MLGDGGSQKEALRPDFNRSILVDFQGAKISSDTGFLLLREMDDRFGLIGPMSDCLEDRRSAVHTRHSATAICCEDRCEVGRAIHRRDNLLSPRISSNPESTERPGISASSPVAAI